MRIKINIIFQSQTNLLSRNRNNNHFLFPVNLKKGERIKDLQIMISNFINKIYFDKIAQNGISKQKTKIDSKNNLNNFENQDSSNSMLYIDYLEIENFKLYEEFEIEGLIREDDIIK